MKLPIYGPGVHSDIARLSLDPTFGEFLLKLYKDEADDDDEHVADLAERTTGETIRELDLAIDIRRKSIHTCHMVLVNELEVTPRLDDPAWYGFAKASWNFYAEKLGWGLDDVGDYDEGAKNGLDMWFPREWKQLNGTLVMVPKKPPCLTRTLEAYVALYSAPAPLTPLRKHRTQVGADGIPDGPGTYFLRADGCNLVKIGKSEKSIRARIKPIMTMSPVTLRLVAYVPNDHRLERKLHVRFAHLRQHGEWFKLAPELEQYIATCVAA